MDSLKFGKQESMKSNQAKITKDFKSIESSSSSGESQGIQKKGLGTHCQFTDLQQQFCFNLKQQIVSRGQTAIFTGHSVSLVVFYGRLYCKR